MGEAIRYAEQNNVVVVAASGNTGRTAYLYPAAYSSVFSNVIAVAASAKGNGFAPYSTTGDWVTVFAPGGIATFVPKAPKVKDRFQCFVGIDDCVVSLGFGLLSPYGAEEWGTSQASPHVAGLVALMISANPILTPSEIRNVIADSASAFSSPPSRPAGSRILNAEAAVLEVIP